MLKGISDFFEQHLARPAQSARPPHTFELAAATLIAEVARLDGGIDSPEREAVIEAVRSQFGLEPAEADALVALAEAESREATDYYQFTSLVREGYSPQERERIVELMWRAAYADARISAHEQHVIRKVADLLHVPHAAYIAAKLRAREQGPPGLEGGARV